MSSVKPSNTKLASRRCSDDAGFTLVLVALLLVALMGFAALTVDIGGVYAARRQDQTAADVAALAAVSELGDEAQIVDTVKDYAHGSLDGPLTNAEWNSCPTPDPAALETQAAGASCISYDATRVRVRLPDRFYTATLGRVLGVDSYRHSAFAVAGLEPVGFGGVLPWFTTSTGAQAGYWCIGADGPSECNNDTGKFGLLYFSYYQPTCASGSHQHNIAAGIDHQISLYNRDPHGTTVVVSALGNGSSNGCPALPNGTYPENGNEHAPLRNGLFLGRNGLTGPAGLFRDDQPARLQRSWPDTSLPRATRFARNVDDTPLWHFIDDSYPAGTDIPNSCRRNQFVNSSGVPYANIQSNTNLPPNVRAYLAPYEQADEMIGLVVRCVRHYMGLEWSGEPVSGDDPPLGTPDPPTGCVGHTATPRTSCTDPVFTRDDQAESLGGFDIQLSPRFGYSPQAVTVPTSGPILFDRYRAIYLQRIIMGNSNNLNQSCRWDPGVPLVGGECASPPNNEQTAILAIHFPDTMLPGNLGGETGPEGDTTGTIALVR